MAKMFYTLDEVCQKLGKSEDEITEMVRSGLIQEFRDRDKLMFKVEQIDLLAGGEDDTSEVTLDLEDTSGGSGVALKGDAGDAGDAGEAGDVGGSGIALSDSREDTGISVFDTDHGSSDDASDQTDADEAIEEEELELDAVGSGSGLLDLTRESDETAVGAELLEDVFSGEQQDVEIPAAASGLFEAAGAERTPEEAVPEVGAPTMPAMVVAYDGSGSGLAAGLLIGSLAALICVAIVGIVGIMGSTPALAKSFASSSGSLWIWAGGLLGITLVLGLVGLFIGKATE